MPVSNQKEHPVPPLRQSTFELISPKMMSNPPSSLQQQHRQRLHRRQNSTPVLALEAMKVTNLPQSPTTRQGAHRRGQSFDQHQRSPIRRQHGSTVSITNLGHHGQQILREAQQQRTARPGQHQVEIPASPQCGLYNTAPSPTTPYENMTMNTIIQTPQGMHFASSPYFSSEMPIQIGYNDIGLVDENNQQYFQSSHQVHQHMGGPFDGRRMSQPDLRVQTTMRPHTPEEKIQNAQFPPTPPFTQSGQSVTYTRSLQTSPAIHSPYPIPMQRGRSLQGIIEREESKQEQRRQNQQTLLVTPLTQSFDIAEMPIPGRCLEAQNQTPQQEPDKEELLPFFDETGGEEVPHLEDEAIPTLSSSRTAAGSQSPSRLALSPRRMSISDLNLEPGINASIEETNVTLDDIAQFIEGPDLIDNKWICKYEDCNKKFGRKENIKSHVQTHLGDRQFRCDHCKKCFVRGHDLKRHAKIHTGTKPYPCLCGNSFARHDALTRHRQRGMCIGAFDGVVKKVIKRGRPRKHRPEMDDRMDKAARSRRRGHDHLEQYASSASSCSISSWGSPPTESMDALSIRGNSPFDDMALFGVPQQNMGMESVGFPPNMFSFTPPASPGYSTGNKPSPSYRELTPTDIGDLHQMQSNHSQMMADLPALEPVSLMGNAMTMQHSQHSLPSLCHSSSSPAADVVAFNFSDLQETAIQPLPMKMEPERNEFDNFLDYGGMDMGLDAGGPDSFFTNL